MTDKTPHLITHSEAVSLSGKCVTTESIFTAKDIYKAFMEAEAQEQDERWSFVCALATIYEAGRIQGMQELRLRSRTQRTQKGGVA